MNVLRDAMAVDSLDPCGVYFGTTGGQVMSPPMAVDNWNADRPRPAAGVIGGSADAVMIRVELPHHLCTLAHVGTEVQLEVEGPVTQRSVLDALERDYPMLRGVIREHITLQRRPFLRFFACEEDLAGIA